MARNKKVLKRIKRRRERVNRGKGKERIPPIFQTVSRDTPLVEDGCRIVGPAQAMMDYAKPLLEKVDMEAEESLNKVFSIAQLCWNLALVKDKKEQAKVKKELLKQIDFPDAESFIEAMIERHQKMFPELGKTTSFYVKERVIDEPDSFEAFDESTLNLRDETFAATETEASLAKKLRELDDFVLDDELEYMEESFFEFQEKITECYQKWCIQKGVLEDLAAYFRMAVSSFLDFVYRYNNATLSTIPAGALREFMKTFFIRKCFSSPAEMSAMPIALKLFTQYLKEKGITTRTNKITYIVKAEKNTFLQNLTAFNNPCGAI